MAMVVHEGASAQRSALSSSPRSAAAIRLLIWIAAAALPWIAILFAVRLVVAG